MNPEDFRRFGHELVDLVADYRARVASQPVQAVVEPGSIRARLPVDPPLAPEPFERVMSDVRDLVLPNIVSWQHPRFFGWFPSNGDPSSVLGDWLASGLGSLGLSWQSSPALTEIEEVATDWMRRMVGLSDAWSGVIQDTASTSSLVALVCARERSSSFSLSRGGLQGEVAPLVVYTSEHAHSSIDKAALVAGFGRDNLRKIAVDSRYAMRADALARAMEEDVARGHVPCAVVATTGTTTTTAMDPIEAIADVARAHGAWLHVDAAMAGSGMILPELREHWRGVEAADSLVFNPHKWLGAAFDCSLYYVRDVEHLVRVLSTSPSYLRSAVDEKVRNYRDWGIPLGRRFRALKLWFLIRERGVDELQARLRRDLSNAKHLEGLVRATPDWRVLVPVALQTVCVRHEPRGIEGEALDAHTQRWAAAVNASGEALVTPAMLDGRWMVRVSIGAIPTERADVEAAWTRMREAAERG